MEFADSVIIDYDSVIPASPDSCDRSIEVKISYVLAVILIFQKTPHQQKFILI
jgi:hypothetical protein